MDEAFSLLWTCMPAELVVDGMFPAAQNCVEMNVEGRILQVLPGADGTGTLQRLISCDPADYLDPRWQPGSRIALEPARES